MTFFLSSFWISLSIGSCWGWEWLLGSSYGFSIPLEFLLLIQLIVLIPLLRFHGLRSGTSILVSRTFFFQLERVLYAVLNLNARIHTSSWEIPSYVVSVVVVVLPLFCRLFDWSFDQFLVSWCIMLTLHFKALSIGIFIGNYV